MIELAIEDPRWLEFVTGRPDASTFHHPRWSLLLSETYGFRPFVLALERRDGSLTAGIPLLEVRGPFGRHRRWVSLPFTDLCRPLVEPDDEPGLAAALDEARLEAGVSRLEIRAPLAGAALVDTHGATTHRLALLEDPDVVFRGFTKNVLRDLRIAERAGLVVRRGETENDLIGVFYGLHVQTRRRLGVPVQPRRFFRLLWRRVIEPGHGVVLIAYAGETPVAATVLLSHGSIVDYKFSASDQSFGELNGTKLIVAEAIRWACLERFAMFDFGRTSGTTEGLRQFKRRFGPTESLLEYSALGGPAASASSGGTGVAGRVLRSSPAWVTRLAGELLYKYAA